MEMCMKNRQIEINGKLIGLLFLAGVLPFVYNVSNSVLIGDASYDYLGVAYIAFAIVSFLISGCITLIISLVVITELNWLEDKFPWSEFSLKRLILEVVVSNITSVAMMGVCSFVLYIIFGIPEDMSIKRYYFYGAVTSVVMNLILTSVIECVNLFYRWKDSLLTTERLEKEMVEAKYQVLKTQVNPHFLFNCLNVLSSLVHTDADKAEEFIDEFARVYRYILEVHEHDLVTVERELDMVQSYIFLQQIRFSSGLHYRVSVEDDCLKMRVPALSLQLMVENAIKHNAVDENQPLRVEIVNTHGAIVVTNSLQPREGIIASTGIGQRNLADRYHYHKKNIPRFFREKNSYVAELPLLD